MKFQVIPLKRIRIKKNHQEDIRCPEHFIVVKELEKKKTKSLRKYYLLLRGIEALSGFKKDDLDNIGCLVFRDDYDEYRNLEKGADRFLFTIMTDEREESLKLLFPSSRSYERILFLLENVGGEAI